MRSRRRKRKWRSGRAGGGVRSSGGRRGGGGRRRGGRLRGGGALWLNLSLFFFWGGFVNGVVGEVGAQADGWCEGGCLGEKRVGGMGEVRYGN